MPDYEFGFSEFTTWPWSFRKDIARYPQHGANCIEVCEFKLPYKEYGEYLREIGGNGLRVASVQAQVHSIFVDSMANKPENPEDRIAEMKEAIELSAPYVPQGTPFVVITGVPPGGNFRKAIDRTVEALRDLGEFAAAHNVRIAFEPLSPVNIFKDTAVWGLDRGLELVECANHSAVGICIDTWNIFQTPNLEDVIRRCGDRIFLVQLSDWKTPRSTADRYSLGDGEIPLASIMRAIRETGYKGAWVVEILSSMHLEGSLWKQNLDGVLHNNQQAFERLWSQSEPASALA